MDYTKVKLYRVCAKANTSISLAVFHADVVTEDSTGWNLRYDGNYIGYVYKSEAILTDANHNTIVATEEKELK